MIVWSSVSTVVDARAESLFFNHLNHFVATDDGLPTVVVVSWVVVMSWPAIFDKKLDGLEMIVFDLDGTLWYTCVTERPSPYNYLSSTSVQDSTNRLSHAYLSHSYPEVAQVLARLSSLGYKLGIASRATPASDALLLIQTFGWKSYFDHIVIHGGKKDIHFTELQKQSKIPFKSMLFFDDEEGNITDVSPLNVICYMTRHPIGTNRQVVQKGLEKFNKIRNNVND